MTKLKWSRYIPHKPTKKQTSALLRSHEKELLYGGALGGGKSDYLLMCCLQYMDVPGYASGIFRRSLTDLKLPGALLDRARGWLQPFLKSKEVMWVPGDHAYHFKTYNPDGSRGEDAKMVFCYSSESNAKDRYQSAEFQTICFDELSHWDTSGDYEFMLTRLRRTVCKIHGKKSDGSPDWQDDCPQCNIKRIMPVRMRCATNPGGLGGAWIKKYFQIVPDPEIYPDKRDAIMAITKGEKVPFVGTHPRRSFIPAFITDNPFLDQEDYDKFLNNLPPEMRSALRDGNWEARVDSRFKRYWVKYYNIFSDCIQIGTIYHPFSYFTRIFMTIDPAGTVKEGIVDQIVAKKAPSYTVISVWGETQDKDLFFLDMKRFRDEVPEVVKEISNMYKKWKKYNSNLYTRMEVNGVGLGPSQYVRRLGIPVRAIKKGKDKLENSTAAMLLMESGKVYFPNNAPWISEAEDEIFAWAGLPSETDDIIDTLSDAANEIGPTEDTVTPAGKERIKTPFVGYRHHSPNLSFHLAPNQKHNPFKSVG